MHHRGLGSIKLVKKSDENCAYRDIPIKCYNSFKQIYAEYESVLDIQKCLKEVSVPHRTSILEEGHRLSKYI